MNPALRSLTVTVALATPFGNNTVRAAYGQTDTGIDGR
jgi:hypothetical protein